VIDRIALRTALARLDLPQYAAAGLARVPPQVLSAMVTGRRPAEPKVVRRLEAALKLPAGSLESPPPRAHRE